MKTKLPLSIILCGLICPAVIAQNNLVDDFNGNAINTSLWNIYNTGFGTPSAGGVASSVTEGNGVVQFVNGGGLITTASFDNATVQGSFQFTGDNDDRFKVYLRSDGTTFAPYWDDLASGIMVQFSPSSNPSPNNPSLQIIDATTGNLLAQASPNISMDTYDTFDITDSGSQISVYLNGSVNPTLSAETTASYGNQIGIFNREQAAAWGPNHISQLDFISVSAVPEPQSIALVGVAAVLLFTVTRKRRVLC